MVRVVGSSGSKSRPKGRTKNDGSLRSPALKHQEGGHD